MKFFLLLVAFSLTLFCSKAQIVNGCTYLKSNFLEIGIAPNGSFGTPEDAPAGYHPRPTPLSNSMFNPITNTYRQRPQAIGFVADFQKDGWGVGTPAYMGDYFMPGTIQEGFSIEVNGVKSDAWSNNYGSNGATGYIGTMTGAPIDYNAIGTSQSGTWKGQFGALIMKQVILLRENKSYFTSTVTLKNSGTDTLRKIYYMRTVDPDNEVSVTGSFVTKNKIDFKLPNSSNKTLVTARGTQHNAYLGLGTKFCDAKPFYLQSGLFASAGLENIYTGNSVSNYGFSDSLTGDVGIGVVFKIGNIPPGDSITFAYAYILNETDLEDAFSDLDINFNCSGSIFNSGSVYIAPTGTAVPISVNNGTSYNWTWSPATNLNTSTGGDVIATVSSGPITYTVTGVSNGTVLTSCNVRVVTITVSPVPFVPPPTVLSLVKYCKNQTTSPLSATPTSGGVLVWYNVPVGGTPLASVPTPSSAVEGTQIWYVSQIVTGIESQRLPITVIIHPLPTVSINPLNAAVCLGDTIGLKAFGTIATYTWLATPTSISAGVDSIRVFPNVPTTYTVNAIDSNSCTAVASKLVQINPKPTITLSPTNPGICLGDSVTLTAIGASNLVWSPAATLNTSIGSTVIAKPTSTTTYSVSGNNSFGCKNTTSLSVTLQPFPVVNLGPDKFICIDSIALLNPGIHDTYLWQDGSASPTFSTNIVGTYWVRVTNVEGCKAYDTIKILGINARPANFLPKDTILCRGNDLTLSAATSYSEYLWFNGATTPTVTVATPGSYLLQVKDATGCAGKDSIRIIDRNCIPFNIPNAFTPNKDGVNDIFNPLITQQVTNYKFNVFNRWGNILFSTSNPNTGWDGKHKGQDQSLGAYIYYIQFKDFDGVQQSYKGTVIIVR